MAEIYLHIGLQKTGTSFLQHHYFPKVENVNYFNYLNFKHFGLREMRDIHLISHEGLCGVPWNQDWRNGKNNNHHWKESFNSSIHTLKAFFPEAHIVITFRRHGDLLLSLYKQYLHEGGILQFSSFYDENGIIRDVDLNFEYRINLLKKNFEKVDVLNFEKFKKEGPKYFTSYFSEIGFDEVKMDNFSKQNKSISGKKLELLRRANIIYPKFPGILRKALFKSGFNPRKLFQDRLEFWNTPDQENLITVKKEVNKKFLSDWSFVEENEYRF